MALMMMACGFSGIVIDDNEMAELGFFGGMSGDGDSDSDRFRGASSLKGLDLGSLPDSPSGNGCGCKKKRAKRMPARW